MTPTSVHTHIIVLLLHNLYTKIPLSLLPGSLYLWSFFFCQDKQQIDLLHIFEGIQFFLLYCIKYMEKSYLLHILAEKKKKTPQDSTSMCGMWTKICKKVRTNTALFSTKLSFTGTSFFLCCLCLFVLYYFDNQCIK